MWFFFRFITWEQRKLCHIAQKVIEKNENINITETFTNSAEFGIISQRDYFDHDISNFDNLSGYYVVQNDDFVYNPRISVTAPVGPINRNKLGRKGVMSPLYTVFRVSNIDFTFLEWYFKSEHWHGFMRFNGDSGARSDRFSIKDETMFQMPLPYPNIYEQKLVGKFISKIDNLITLHQRKQNDGFSLFKPKNYALFLANSWEQRKLGDIADRVVRKNSNLESTLPLTISAQYGLVDQIEYFNNRVASRDLSGYYLVRNGEFAYNKSYSDGYPFGAIKRLDMYKMGVLSTLYIVFSIKSDEIDSEYLVAYYETNKWHRQVAERAAEGARNHGLLNISANDFFETKLKYPFKIGEQSKIGDMFKQLDNLITLHQREHKQKMSPILNENRLCFQGVITNAWEQRKAETLFISYVEKGFPDLPVLSATQDKGMVYRDYAGKSVFHDKNNEIGYKRVQPGQFVIHLRSFQGGFAHSNILGITSPAYTIFGFKEGERQYDLFWKCIFSSPNFIRRLESVTYGIRDGRSISYDEFLTMKFIIPEYNEQIKIATCLIKTDNLITLHQRGLIKIQGDKNGKKRSFRRIVQRLF